MAAYATVDQWTQWTGHLILDDRPTGDAIAAVLERASLDLDTYLGHPAPATVGLRIALSDLTEYQRDMLSKATVAQAAYRCMSDLDADLIEGRSRIVSVGTVGFATDAPDRCSPEALSLLSGTGLLRRTATGPPDAAA